MSDEGLGFIPLDEETQGPRCSRIKDIFSPEKARDLRKGYVGLYERWEQEDACKLTFLCGVCKWWWRRTTPKEG